MNFKFYSKIVYALILILSFTGCNKDEFDEGLKTETQTSLKSAETISFSEVESNNTIQSANGIVNPYVNLISGTTSYPGDFDWYKIYCSSGVSQNLNYKPFSNGTAQILDAQSNVIATLQSNGSYNFIPSYSGYYYLKVVGLTGTYTININQTGAKESENNDDFNSADPLNNNEYITGKAEWGYTDKDFFELNISPTDATTILLSAENSQITGVMYNQNGVALGTLRPEIAYTFTNVNSGKYYIKIQGTAPTIYYPGVNYALYINPTYSQVNPKYFKVHGGDYRTNSYECCSNSFETAYYENTIIDEDNYFPLNFIGYMYLYNNGFNWVSGIYSTGFPKIGYQGYGYIGQ